MVISRIFTTLYGIITAKFSREKYTRVDFISTLCHSFHLSNASLSHYSIIQSDVDAFLFSLFSFIIPSLIFSSTQFYSFVWKLIKVILPQGYNYSPNLVKSIITRLPVELILDTSLLELQIINLTLYNEIIIVPLQFITDFWASKFRK